MTSTPRTAWQRWVHFWFAPGDPTTMGFLRVVVGTLVLYIHLAYTFDLYAFFGENGWYGLEQINRERREFPWSAPPVADGWKWWDESARLPDEPHRRQALLAYLRSLPAAKDEVEKKLRVLATDPPEAGGYPEGVARNAAIFANGLGPNKESRDARLKALSNEIKRDAKEAFPPEFDQLVDPSRPADPNWRLKLLARDLDEFYTTLPQPNVLPTDTAAEREEKTRRADDARKYICLFLLETNYVNRHNFLQFARDLAASTPSERERKLDYLAYWNVEHRYVHRTGSPIFSLWFHVHTPEEMAVAHAVMLVIMLMFTLGLFTRVTAVLTWLAAVSYIHRNQQVLFGQDTMMNILLIYLMVSNAGAALSLDRLIDRYRAARGSLRRCGRIDEATARFLAAPPPSVASAFAQRLLQVHFCFIYLASGLSKLKGAAWWNTNAFWDTVANPEFTYIHYQWYQELLRWTADTRLVYATAASISVAFTLFMEIGLPFLVWTRLRPYMVIGGFLLHFGIGGIMGLLTFSLLMMCMLASYLPGSVIRGQLFGPPKPKTPLPFDPGNEKDVSRAAWAVAKDMGGGVDPVAKT